MTDRVAYGVRLDFKAEDKVIHHVVRRITGISIRDLRLIDCYRAGATRRW